MRSMFSIFKKLCCLMCIVTAMLVFQPTVSAAQSPDLTNGGGISDLTGVWNFNTLATSTGASRWSRGSITVQGDGSYTASGTDTDGNIINLSGTFTLSSDGLTMTGTGGTETLCQVDKGGTLLSCTQTEADYAPGLIVASKKAASCTLADLVGTWQFSRLAGAPGPQWMRSTIVVAADGSFTEKQKNSDGTRKTKTGTLAVTPDGEVTATSCSDCGDSDAQLVLDSGKTLIVRTDTKQDTPIDRIGVFVKTADSYSLADAVGTWEENCLASSTAHSYWRRATITVKPSGSFTYAGTDSDGNPQSASGNLSLSTTGVLTCTTCTDSDMRMVMDSGKSVLMLTETANSATFQLGVITKNPFKNKPDAPIATAATEVGTAGFTANWTDPYTNASVTGYRIDVATDSAFTAFLSGYNNRPVTGTSLAVSGLASGKAYYYRVRAENAVKPSANSNTIKVKTNAFVPTVGLPTANSVTKSGAVLGATIQSNGGAKIISAGVAYGTSENPSIADNKVTSTDLSGNFAVAVTGLSSNTLFHYRGYATNSQGTGYTTDATFTTKPGSPTATAATNPSTTGFTANWAPPSGTAAITGYYIDVAKDSLFTVFVTGYKNLPVSGASVAVTGLKAGKTYYYRVRAVNAGGTGKISNVISIKLPTS